MRQNKIVSILILVGLIGSGCNTFAVQPSQTPTEIPSTIALIPTITSTLTPTIVPSPTATFTPSPTAIAGGNGNLLLSCTDAEGDREQNKIFSYDIGSGSIKPHTPSLSNNEGLFQFEEVLAASPSGRVALWRKCDFTPTINACDIYLSDGTLSTNKSFDFPYRININSYQFVSDDNLFFATIYNFSDFRKGQPALGASFFLQNIRNNEIMNLGSRDDGQLGDFYLSPTGRFLANEYFYIYHGVSYSYEEVTQRGYIVIIDLQEQRILDLNLHGNSPEWFADDKLLYSPVDSDYLYIVDISTGEFEKLEEDFSRLSPDGNWLVYPEWVNRNFQFILQTTSDGTKIPILEPSFFYSVPLRWSPNGKQIIYSIRTETTVQIRLYDIDTKVTSLLLEFNLTETEMDGIDALELGGNLYKYSTKSYYFYASWSPDGKWFIMGFQNDKELRPINHFDYFLCNFTGCKLIKPPDTTYCTKAIWISE